MDSNQSHSMYYPERVEAIRRLKQYQDDFAEWRRLGSCVKEADQRVVEEEQKKKRKKKALPDRERRRNQAVTALRAWELSMQARWKLRSPFVPPPPDVPADETGLRGRSPLLSAAPIEVLDPFDGARQLRVEGIFPGYDPLRLQAGEVPVDYTDLQGKNARKGTKPTLQHIGGKHLCMMMDVTLTERELLERLKGFLKYYQGMMPTRKTTGKRPTTAVKIWEVYDLADKGLLVGEIAKQLIPKNATGGNAYSATFKAVERAIKKATLIMKEVRQDLSTGSIPVF